MTHILPWIVVIIYLKGYYDMFSERGPVVFTCWMIIAFLFLGMVYSVSRKTKKQK